jgi:hypothetical protein
VTDKIILHDELRSVTGKQFATGALLALLQQSAPAADAAMVALLAEKKTERKAKPAAGRSGRAKPIRSTMYRPLMGCVGCRVTAAVGAAGRRPPLARAAAPAPRCCRRTGLAWSCAVAHRLLSLSVVAAAPAAVAAPLAPPAAAVVPPPPPPPPVMRECCICFLDVQLEELLLFMPCAHRCVCEDCADALMM